MRNGFYITVKKYLARAMLALALLLPLATLHDARGETLRDDGIHFQPWIKNLTFLDLKEDASEAQASGKGLVILFEQVGCGSCKRLHEENFSKPDLVKYITDNFDMIQINMYGDKNITDFDGEELSEVRYTEKKMINFSPTTLFIGPDGNEIFRMPGYMKPYFYQSGFEYVKDQGPQKGILFPRWLKQKRDRLQADEKKS